MPGCLGLDAMWQIVGYWLGWSGSPGKGRAVGVGEVTFRGAIKPDIILARISTFGPDGPYANRVGFDTVAQAMSGAMAPFICPIWTS